MTKAQRAHQQPRHYLVADAQAQGGIEHVVGQGNGRAHGDHVTADQRQLHARLALGDAIAHGRDTTGHLTGGTEGAQSFADLRGEGLIGLVRGEHVVIGRHHADVHLVQHPQTVLVRRRTAGHAMGEVAAGQVAAPARTGRRRGHLLQIGRPGVSTAFNQPLGNLDNSGVHAFLLSDQCHGGFCLSYIERMIYCKPLKCN